MFKIFYFSTIQGVYNMSNSTIENKAAELEKAEDLLNNSQNSSKENEELSLGIDFRHIVSNKEWQE